MTTRRFSQRRRLSLAVEAAQPGSAMLSFHWHDEAGVVHSERLEYPPPQERAQRHPFEPRHEKAEQVVRDPVVKPSTWLVDQRHRCEPCDPFIRRDVIVDLGSETICEREPNGAAMELSIRQPRAVRQQSL